MSGYITTDGTIGELLLENIVNWNLQIDVNGDGVSVTTISDPTRFQMGGTFILVRGRSALTATAGGLCFDSNALPTSTGGIQRIRFGTGGNGASVDIYSNSPNYPQSSKYVRFREVVGTTRLTRVIFLERIQIDGVIGFDGVIGLTAECDSGTVVDIDIKPGSAENTVNLGSKGVTKVAILGSDDFNATEVDPTTVELADATVRVKGNGQPLTTIQDTNGDGFLDLVLHVDTEGFTLTDGDVSAELTGSTFGGDDIFGEDMVRVVP